MTEQLRVVSYGGGVQSTALLVLAAQGRIDHRIFLFANTGDDSEEVATLDYVRTVAAPYAMINGITLHELRRHRRDGSIETLYGRMHASHSGAVVIPVKLSADGPPGRRSCTADFKVRVIAKWLKGQGVTKDQPALVALGISLDEMQRARLASGEPTQQVEYPLIRMRLDRDACTRIIRGAGLPVPPKSACWFCPYKTGRRWQEMRDTTPDIFSKAVALEAMLNAKRAKLGQSQVFLHNRRVPLPMATSPNKQGTMFGNEVEDSCESGYCMV